MKTVAVLCCSKNSIYKTIPGCDCYDIKRDAGTFKGGMPVVAHPPCRLWSAFCSHQAKSKNPEEEKALGVFCADQVKKFGGVLEQPAHSRLWSECGLPIPGQQGSIFSKEPRESFAIEMPQYWFGDTREKNTWVYVHGVHWTILPALPFRLKPEGGDRRIWQLMSSKNQRERTPIKFAEWLVACARSVK